MTAASLAATAARAVPMLLLAEGRDEREAVSPPSASRVVEEVAAPAPIPIE